MPARVKTFAHNIQTQVLLMSVHNHAQVCCVAMGVDTDIGMCMHMFADTRTCKCMDTCTNRYSSVRTCMVASIHSFRASVQHTDMCSAQTCTARRHVQRADMYSAQT